MGTSPSSYIQVPPPPGISAVSNMFPVWENMWQSPKYIARVLLEANKGYRTIISEKYADVSRDAPVEAIRKRSLSNKK